LKKISIATESIKLDQFLKWADISQTGGHSKILISEGKIKVNGEIEKRRGRQLKKGDVVSFQSVNYLIE
jgi:ribosome-associated protein